MLPAIEFSIAITAWSASPLFKASHRRRNERHSTVSIDLPKNEKAATSWKLVAMPWMAMRSLTLFFFPMVFKWKSPVYGGGFSTSLFISSTKRCSFQSPLGLKKIKTEIRKKDKIACGSLSFQQREERWICLKVQMRDENFNKTDVA